MKQDTVAFTAFEDYQVWDSSKPERNLLQAILGTALEDLRRGGYHARQARNFFLSNNDAYLFSFTSICDQLGICPNKIRSALAVKYPGHFTRKSAQRPETSAAEQIAS